MLNAKKKQWYLLKVYRDKIYKIQSDRNGAFTTFYLSVMDNLQQIKSYGAFANFGFIAMVYLQRRPSEGLNYLCVTMLKFAGQYQKN